MSSVVSWLADVATRLLLPLGQHEPVSGLFSAPSAALADHDEMIAGARMHVWTSGAGEAVCVCGRR